MYVLVLNSISVLQRKSSYAALQYYNTTDTILQDSTCPHVARLSKFATRYSSVI